jgi:hypothetical protein
MPRGIKKVEEKVEEVKEVKIEFSVFDEKGMFIRTYSVEVHGKEADKLAEGYALKINGTIK